MIEAVLIAGAVGALFGALAHKGWLWLEKAVECCAPPSTLGDKDA